MSTSTKRPLAQAMADAEAFYRLFDATCYEQWRVAGSVRRKRPEVGDVEHVVRPTIVELAGDGLFAEPVLTNLLWRRLDELVAAGTVAKAWYGTSYRWGDKHRGVTFRGFTHELFTADQENWGSILTIRTGPAEFSQRMVTELRKRGRRNDKGYVWECEPCPVCGVDKVDKACRECQGTCLKPIRKLPCPREQEFFELCGVGRIEPERRV